MTFITKIINKHKIKKINAELNNVEKCMLDWCHGDMGYQQTKEEMEELETKKNELEKAKNKLINGGI